MPDAWTQLGGGDNRFPLTRRTLVALARGPNEGERRGALEVLARTYWKPLYCYLRATGKRNEDAKDLVQGFFGSFLERDALRDFDPAKGKFRSFLLVCLKAHLGHEREKAQALKRGGGRARFSLDVIVAEDDRGVPSKEESPDAVYERAWALSKLDRAVAAVRSGLQQRKDEAALTVLEGYLQSDNLARPGYAKLSTRSGLTENKVRHLLHDFRKRLQEAMLEEIRAETRSEEQAREEMAWLFQCLGKR